MKLCLASNLYDEKGVWCEGFGVKVALVWPKRCLVQMLLDFRDFWSNMLLA